MALPSISSLVTGSVSHAPDLRHQVLIVGGGAAGISVAARLRRRRPGVDVAVLDSAERHFYQPLWTLVGAGEVPRERTARPEASVIPAGVSWIRESAASFEPDHARVTTSAGRRISYDWLVIAAGIQLDWDGVAGLPESLGTHGVASNWSYETVGTTWELIRDFRGGTAIFTLPDTPVKCPGAAQKIMYLAEEHFRRSGVRHRSRVVFASAAAGIFGVEKYARTLRGVLERKGIQPLFRHNLVEIDPRAREAVFDQLDTGERVVIPYDLLHVAPPQSAPDVIKRSPLADARGWAEAQPHTLQSPRWPNVFALGDVSNLPTAKTAAAVRHQARVVVDNLLAAIAGADLRSFYDGYTACPVVTGYGKLVMAEFDYDLQPRETFPFDQSKERYSMYLLKKHGLPQLYWRGMLRGRA